MKKILSLVVLMTLSLAAWAQVNFTVTQKRVSPTEIDIIFKGTIAQGWHVYSTTVGDGGPTRASFNVDKKDGVELVGKLKDGPGVKTEQDPIFEMPVSFFEHNCSFTQRVKLTKKDYNMKAYMEFGACNDENCLPPTPVDVTVKGSDGPDKTDEATTEESEDAEETAAQENADTTATAGHKLVGIINREPKTSNRIIRQFYLDAINDAQDSIKLVNPYLTLNHKLKRALRKAIRRGVKTEIMVSSHSDIPLTPDCVFYNVHRLMKHGAEVWIYQPGFHHTKVIMVDGRFCTVGSANLNARSLRWDYEENAVIVDPCTTKELSDMFDRDKADSFRLTQESWNKWRSPWKKFVGWFAHLLAPFL